MDETEEKPAASSPIAQLTSMWGKLDARRRIIAAASLLAVMIGLSWITLREPAVDQGLLFSGLSPEDAGRIVQELQARNVPYELTAGGTAISVPEDQVHELRISLAAEGASPVAGAGVGFELFDRQSFGATNFVEQTNFRRALEGELARTIASLNIVERARVHIAMGKRSLYSRQDDPPTASVVLSLVPGARLSSAQRRGIVNMVASSVDGMTAEHVALVDGNGNALSNPGADIDMVGNEAAMDLERTLARRVEKMLEPAVGQGNVEVTVTADLDRAQVERTQELYDQAPDKVALRSEERRILGGEGQPNTGGIAGARGNLPGTAGPGGAPGGAAPGQSVHELKNYEVNKVIERTVGPRQRVKRLHVAVLLDEPLDADGNPISRSPEQLEQLEALARKAAGLDDERGDGIEILSVPFVRAPVPEAEEQAPAEPASPQMPPLWMVATAAAAAVFTLGGFALWIRRRRKRKAAEAAEAEEQEQLEGTLPKTVEELQAELPETATEDQIAMAGKPKLADLDEEAPFLERAAAMAAEDPEVAAQVIRSWLASTNRAPTPANTSDYSEAA